MFAEKVIKNICVGFKIKLLLTKRTGITGTLLPLQKPFNMDQYVFEWSAGPLDH